VNSRLGLTVYLPCAGEDQFGGASSSELNAAAKADIAPGGDGTGHHAGMANLLGPQYGLPGYQATHNWENQNGEK